jgi:hypothetical protein
MRNVATFFALVFFLMRQTWEISFQENTTKRTNKNENLKDDQPLLRININQD